MLVHYCICSRNHQCICWNRFIISRNYSCFQQVNIFSCLSSHSESVQHVRILLIFSLPVIGLQIYHLEVVPQVVQWLDQLHVFAPCFRKHKSSLHRLDLHDVTESHHCYATKGQVVLEDFFWESEVQLVEHFRLDQTDFIDDQKLQISKVCPHIVPVLVIGRHDFVIESKFEHRVYGLTVDDFCSTSCEGSFQNVRLIWTVPGSPENLLQFLRENVNKVAFPCSSTTVNEEQRWSWPAGILASCGSLFCLFEVSAIFNPDMESCSLLSI